MAARWFHCTPLTDCASDSLAYCKKLEDGRVVFYNDDDTWVILSAPKAKEHFQLGKEVDNADDIEETYQWSLKRNQSATSSTGSKSDTESTVNVCGASQDPGQPTP